MDNQEIINKFREMFPEDEWVSAHKSWLPKEIESFLLEILAAKDKEHKEKMAQSNEWWNNRERNLLSELRERIVEEIEKKKKEGMMINPPHFLSLPEILTVIKQTK